VSDKLFITLKQRPWVCLLLGIHPVIFRLLSRCRTSVVIVYMRIILYLFVTHFFVNDSVNTWLLFLHLSIWLCRRHFAAFTVVGSFEIYCWIARMEICYEYSTDLLGSIKGWKFISGLVTVNFSRTVLRI